MKIQMQWLLFILTANLVVGFITNATTQDGDYVFPGMQYHSALNATGYISTYNQTMNATDIMEGISPPATGLDYVIATFNTAYNFFRVISWIWDGFPQFLDWWAGFIPSSGAITIFGSFGWIVRAISLFMFVTLVLEFVRGVQILP